MWDYLLVVELSPLTLDSVDGSSYFTLPDEFAHVLFYYYTLDRKFQIAPYTLKFLFQFLDHILETDQFTSELIDLLLSIVDSTHYDIQLRFHECAIFRFIHDNWQ